MLINIKLVHEKPVRPDSEFFTGYRVSVCMWTPPGRARIIFHHPKLPALPGEDGRTPSGWLKQQAPDVIGYACTIPYQHRTRALEACNPCCSMIFIAASLLCACFHKHNEP
jgi:hypothetical protein